jgi:HSP20 family protein
MFPKSLIRERVFPQVLDLPWQLDRALENVFSHGAGAREGPWCPPLDIRESEDALLIVAELPGVKQEDVEVTVVHGVLTLQGERKVGPAGEGQVVLRRERMAGPFVRRILLPGSVNGAAVTATYQDGVLTIRAPKKEAAKPKRIAIEVN